jgi:hypothetical protein
MKLTKWEDQEVRTACISRLSTRSNNSVITNRLCHVDMVVDVDRSKITESESSSSSLILLCFQDKSIGHWRFSCVMSFPWRPILSGKL